MDRPLQTFTDPTEGAFTLSVPDGWRVQGGVTRGGFPPRPWYRALSPGGAAELRSADPRMPPSFLDAPFGAMGMPVPMRPFVPPTRFAEEYAYGFARETGAARFEVTGARDLDAMLREDPRPEIHARVQSLVQLGAVYGGVTFACPDRGAVGLVDVCILRMPGPFGVNWSPSLLALLGPEGPWPHVKATLLAIVRSYTANPVWQQQQAYAQQVEHQMAMDTINAGSQVLRMQAQSGMEAIAAHAQRAAISAQASEATSAAQMQSWQAQQASSDERQRRAVNAVRETVDVQDPASGRVYRGAPAGFATYWTDGADAVVASEGSDNPDASRFRQATDLDDLPGGKRRT